MIACNGAGQIVACPRLVGLASCVGMKKLQRQPQIGAAVARGLPGDQDALKGGVRQRTEQPPFAVKVDHGIQRQRISGPGMRVQHRDLGAHPLGAPVACNET